MSSATHTCQDCGRPITARSRTGRCRACHARYVVATRERGGFDTALSRAALAAREAKRAENTRLAELARAAGLA